MKTIGLIGGMSWESSKLYYQFANEYVKELLGGSHSCKCIMVSVDFAEIERYTFSNQWDKIGEMMASCTKQLETAGADVILLCTNTIHLVSDSITSSTHLPFIHIAQATGEAIKAKGLSRVGLLGTKFTMEKDFYTKILEQQYGLEVIIPSSKERQLIHDIIYNELVKGQFTEDSKKKCIDLINTLTKAGAEGVIMGCTELPILVSSNEVKIPTFDTTKIHINQAIEWAIA